MENNSSSLAVDPFVNVWGYLQHEGLDFLFAILILIIGRYVAKALSFMSYRMLTRANGDETMARFIKSIVYASLLTLFILSAMNKAGIHTTSFVAILGAAGLAVGLSLKNMITNIGDGVVLLLFRSFKAGDMVKAGGVDNAIVEEINLFNTTLRTEDNVVITVTNTAMRSGNIVNYSAKPIRRLQQPFSVKNETLLEETKRVIFDVIAENTEILNDPSSEVLVSAITSSSYTVMVRYWVENEVCDTTALEFLEACKRAFEQNNIQLV